MEHSSFWRMDLIVYNNFWLRSVIQRKHQISVEKEVNR
jgi:hypothetical protein